MGEFFCYIKTVLLNKWREEISNSMSSEDIHKNDTDSCNTNTLMQELDTAIQDVAASDSKQSKEENNSKNPNTQDKIESKKRKEKPVKHKKALAYVLAGVLALTGGVLYTEYISYRTEVKLKMDMEGQNKIKNDVLYYMSEKHTSQEVETTMLKAFPNLSAQNCTSLVDTYLYGVYNAAAQYALDDSQTNSLYAALQSDGTFDMSLVTDKELKNQVQELKDEHIVLKYLNGSIFWDVDYEYFDTTFGDYLIPDYKVMIHFYAEEKKNSYCDEGAEKLYTDVVISRLNTLFDMMCSYPDSEIYDIMKESYYFYKAVYLGAYAQDYIFDSGSIRPEILDSYKAYQEECKDDELKIFLQTLIKDYADTDGVRTIPVYESIKNFCGFYEENKKES